MTPQEEARARLQVLKAIMGAVPPRLRARKMPADLRDLAISGDEANRIVLHDRRDTACLVAAAILNGNDIARLISAADRELLDPMVDRNTRYAALENRELARPKRQSDAEACLSQIEADRAACAVHWFDPLPREIRQHFATDQALSTDEYLSPALSRALSLEASA